MLKYIEEDQKYIEINGFRGVCIEDAKAFAEKMCERLPIGVEIQLFNADLIATWQHLYFATLNAMVAFKTKRNISKTLALETTLYASAQRQIKKALDLMGVNISTNNIAILILGPSGEQVNAGLEMVEQLINAKTDESVLDLSKPKIRKIKVTFKIADAEFNATLRKGVDQDQALIDLVLERGALLSTRL